MFIVDISNGDTIQMNISLHENTLSWLEIDATLFVLINPNYISNVYQYYSSFIIKVD